MHVNISGKCISPFDACPNGEVYFMNKCIKIVYQDPSACPKNHVLLNSNCVKQAVCKPPLTLDFSDNTCKCPPNSVLNKNRCIPCGVNEVWANYQCKCI